MKKQTIRKSKYTNGGMKFYKSGGMHYMNGGLPRYGQKRKFQTGGSIYDDNTVQSAGQGGVGSTASLVFQESNPELQEQRLQALDAAKTQSIEQAEDTSNKVEQIQVEGQAQADFDAQQAKDTYLAKEEGLASTAKSVYDTANQAGAFNGIKATRAANLAATTAGGTVSSSSVGALNAGSQAIGKGIAQNTGQVVAKDFGTGLVRNKLVGEGAKTIGGGVAKGTMSGASLIGEGAKAGGKMAGFGGAGATGIGTLGKFATSGAGLGIAANLIGSGISKWSDDGDPTKSNFGEYSGSILSSAGTGASYGSFLGPVGTLFGGIAGGIYGGAKRCSTERRI